MNNYLNKISGKTIIFIGYLFLLILASKQISKGHSFEMFLLFAFMILCVLSFLYARYYVLAILCLKPVIDIFYFISTGQSTGLATKSGSGLNIQSMVALFSCAVFFSFAIDRLRKEENVDVEGKHVALILLLIFSYTLSLVMSIRSMPVPSIFDYSKFMSGISIYFIGIFLFQISPKKYMETFYKWFPLCFVPVLVLGYLQLGGFLPIKYYTDIMGGRTPRITCFYSHPSDLTRYVIYLFPVLLYLLLYFTQSKLKKIVYVLVLVMLLPILVLNYHRVAYLILSIQLILLTWFWRKRYALVIFLSLCIIVASNLFFFKSEFASITYLYSSEEGISFDKALHGRGRLFRTHIAELRERDFVDLMIGKGLRLKDYYADYHNDFFAISLGNGVIGLILVALIYINFIKSTLYCYSLSKDKFYIAILAVIIGHILYGITTTVSLSVNCLWYFYFHMAYVSVQSKRLMTKNGSL